MAQLQSSVKRIGILFLSFVAVLLGMFVYVLSNNEPPRENQLIENFYMHRAAYERLRDMLIEDNQLLGVATWGVETINSAPHRVRPEGDFSINRYEEYLALLGQIGAKGAYRSRGKPNEVGILVWAGGWGGDTRHLEVYWTDRAPPKQVSRLDDYYKTAKPRHPVFKHIEGNWYLWADW